MLSLLFVLFITAASGVSLGCIINVPGSRIRTLETGVGTLVSVSVTVVDAGPWDGPSIHYCHTHGNKCPHPSFKCPEPNTGHIKNAPKRDTRGGSDK